MATLLRSAKPLASLSSGLLARKGQARPAMRPQGFAELTPASIVSSAALDDLGWNDMGWAQGEGSSPAASLTPMDVPEAEVPVVLTERESLREQVEAAPVVAPAPARSVSLATATRIGRESAAQTAKGKAAFTLRLDRDRHLRLRLASAVADLSAQALMVQALDQFLTTMPTVEQLATQLPEPALRSRRR